MALEKPLRIRCGDDVMAGLLHLPAGQDDPAAPGVLFIVGGPQIRTGSHRQFTLLARQFAASGLPVMRFDCRGKGDSGGAFADFDRIEDDIQAAIDRFAGERPDMKTVILWGLCDGASAALLYAYKDRRVGGIVFMNPWVRTEAGEARAYLKHYYLQRILGRDFWKKLLGGGLDPVASLRSVAGFAGTALSGVRAGRSGPADAIEALALPEKLASRFALYAGPALLILSGNDLTAQEFEDCIGASPRWPALLSAPGVVRRKLHDADHTFSRRSWRGQVADWTLTWIRESVIAA